MYFENSCIFAEFPLDPCDHLRGDDMALHDLVRSQDARFITLKDGKALMDSDTGQIPLYGTYKDNNGEFVFLGKDAQHSYFAARTDVDSAKGRFIDLRTIARKASADGFSSIPSLLARAKMILDWHDRHQFCAKCGQKTASHKGGYVRKCPACETEHFPRVDPVVIMMVIYKDKCLLGRNAQFPPGMYSALAGFMEPGETIEEAVRREVWEEAGIKVGNVRYIKSQPWPFPSSLMIGAIAQAVTDEIDLGADELEHAAWFSKEQIINVLKTGGDDQLKVPEKLAIARHLLEHWIAEN